MQLTKVRHNKRTLEATLEHVARTRPVTKGVRHLEVVEVVVYSGGTISWRLSVCRSAAEEGVGTV